jgi:hypothetical protein
MENNVSKMCFIRYSLSFYAEVAGHKRFPLCDNHSLGNKKSFH